jgi:hypothetical protein
MPLFRRVLALLLVLLIVAAVAACSPSGPGVATPAGDDHSGQPEGEEGHVEENAVEDNHVEDHSANRIPNEGAVVRIVSPVDGTVFQAADELVVEVETENFDLAEAGHHWHVYVDDTSYGMIVGGDTTHVLRNLQPGPHEIAVYLSVESHEELQDGDAAMIVVEE